MVMIEQTLQVKMWHDKLYIEMRVWYARYVKLFKDMNIIVDFKEDKDIS